MPEIDCHIKGTKYMNINVEENTEIRQNRGIQYKEKRKYNIKPYRIAQNKSIHSNFQKV